MKEFKWNNTVESIKFWNTDENEIQTRELTSKETVNNPSGSKFEDTLRALCSVVSELVEIEENRAKENGEENPKYAAKIAKLAKRLG